MREHLKPQDMFILSTFFFIYTRNCDHSEVLSCQKYKWKSLDKKIKKKERNKKEQNRKKDHK